MADHTIAAGEIAKHNITLAAGVVDTVTFTGKDADRVQILNTGSAMAYYTVDGSTPTVDGGNCYPLPGGMVDEVEPPTGGETVVKLISAGAPTITVVRR